MKLEIAIIGDRFMRSRIFIEALTPICGPTASYRWHDYPWPDEHMVHGHEEPGLDGIKEYFGSVEDVVKHVGKSDILITHIAPIPASAFDAMENLKFIAVSRGGPVNVDLDAAARRGITVVNAPGRNATAVAEFTIGAILTETRNITKGHEALRNGVYRGDLYRYDLVENELRDMTVGIVGYGIVGKLVVGLLRAFQGEILVYDPFAQLSGDDRQAGVRQVELDELLSRSDVVSLHARVMPDTVGMMGREQFSAMKSGATFINTARGPLVDYDALFDALNSGKLRGAMLDTFSTEPPPLDMPLLKLPNVTITPHIAGASRRTIRTAAKQIAKEVGLWIDGKPPVNSCI